jgi:acetyl-CoA carboxylase carboxyl transferase subunit alpha
VVDRLRGRPGETKVRRDGRVRAAPADARTAVWNRVQLARNLARPRTLELLAEMADEVIELHGDRGFGDDPAIVAGFARIDGRRVAFVGQQKGADTDENIRRNFGMPHPEGYRKALRVMHIAEKFGHPIFTFVDTDGAHPGLGAEERGQGEAIAYNLREMARLKVPIIATVIGVGGSGGALAIAVADRVLMMENAVYSVISPEGCASIMWRDATKKDLAAEAMKITASDLSDLGCIDGIVPEPEGGAHSDHEAAATLLDKTLQTHYAELKKLPIQELVVSRYNKFRNMAQFFRVEA